MELIQVDTSNRAQVRRFLRLPFDLYRDVPQWVPPLAPDARRMLDRRRHPFYRNSTAAFFLAVDGSRTVGRLAVLDNADYNAFNHERTAFFYLFECENDIGTAAALFDAGFAWARARGLDRMIGPRGFSVFDGLGLLVRGFEHRPAFRSALQPALLLLPGRSRRICRDDRYRLRLFGCSHGFPGADPPAVRVSSAAARPPYRPLS